MGVGGPEEETRRAMTALLERLDADLLSHDSATLTLERWCAVHHLAAAPVRAELVRGVERPATPMVRRDLEVGADEPIRYRRVRLSCGERVLSEADNWYLPRLLTTAMNRLLDETDVPFGRVVLPLGYSRRTLDAEKLWRQGAPMRDIPIEILRHRAVLTRRDGAVFSEVVETYQRAMLDVARPG